MKYQYETDRLLLRILNKANAPEVLDFYINNIGDFELYEPITDENFYTLEYHEKVLEYEGQAMLNGSMIRYWISLKNDPDFIIGTISFRDITRNPAILSCEVGYKIDGDYRENGYCTEALSFLIGEVFLDLELHRITACIKTDNHISMHMLEKLGFREEGLMKKCVYLNGAWTDHYLYALLEENFSSY